MKLRAPRFHRTSVLLLTAFACIVAGVWVVFADLFGPAIGAGAGLISTGIALLFVEGLQDPPPSEQQ